jgi:hypothetical protein
MLFWGAVMAFASLVPLVGTALIWVPAAGYLFLSGHWGYGILWFSGPLIIGLTLVLLYILTMLNSQCCSLQATTGRFGPSNQLHCHKLNRFIFCELFKREDGA